tara:strand:+ start:837 stop:1277 length:441 start_codon:yes stop_codon:yes gene_type:complete
VSDGTEKRLTIRFDPAIASSTGKPSPDFEESVIRNNPIPWDARDGQQVAMDFDFDGLPLGGYPGEIVWHWHDLKAYQRMFATEEYFVIQLGGYSEGLPILPVISSGSELSRFASRASAGNCLALREPTAPIFTRLAFSREPRSLPK